MSGCIHDYLLTSHAFELSRRRTGEPKVDWFEVQPTLLRCGCDVLLILDCCHASLATKGRDKGRLEVLAATDDAGFTPQPGPHSFTHFLVQILERAHAEKKGIRVLELQKLLNDTAHRNPFYINLRSDPRSSILLCPLPDHDGSQISRAAAPDPLAALTFTVCLDERLSLSVIRDIGDWLKSTAPRQVSHINVDRIVDLSEGIQEFVFGNNAAGVKGRLIDECSEGNRNSLLALLRGVALEVAEARARMASRGTRLVDDDGVTVEALAAIERLEYQVNSVFRMLLCVLSEHPSFQDPTQLESLLANQVAGRAGLTEPIQLCLVAIGPNLSAQPSLESGSVRFDRLCDNTVVYVTGYYQKTGERVLVELVPDNELESDLRRTQSLLSQPIPENLHIPRCIGVISEPTSQRQGLVFSPRRVFQTAMSLVEVFRDGKATPPLEERFRIAHKLALSLQAVHLVRWIHKGVRASNVLVLRRNDGSVDPYLLGFRMSREGDGDIKSLQLPEYRAEHRIYLPRERWGTPTERFNYQHDVYAMVSYFFLSHVNKLSYLRNHGPQGILLLEIGLWSSWDEVEPRLQRTRITYDEARSYIDRVCQGYLTQAMGTRYAAVVTHCLGGSGNSGAKHRTRMMDFETRVVSELHNLSTSLAASP